MSLVSDIKLIRTDTTLDLSQKAEKGMSLGLFPDCLYSAPINRIQLLNMGLSQLCFVPPVFFLLCSFVPSLGCSFMFSLQE